MLNPVAYRLLHTPSNKRFEVAETGFLYRIVKYKTDDKVSPMLKPEASWRKMQLTCPPTVNFSFHCETWGSGKWLYVGPYWTMVGEVRKLVRVENKDGVTVGDLACALFEHWYQCKSCPITVMRTTKIAQPMSPEASGYDCLEWMQWDWEKSEAYSV